MLFHPSSTLHDMEFHIQVLDDATFEAWDKTLSSASKQKSKGRTAGVSYVSDTTVESLYELATELRDRLRFSEIRTAQLKSELRSTQNTLATERRQAQERLEVERLQSQTTLMREREQVSQLIRVRNPYCGYLVKSLTLSLCLIRRGIKLREIVNHLRI